MTLGAFLRALPDARARETRNSPAGTPAKGGADTKLRAEVLNDFESLGLGWFWATDEHGRLSYLSEGAAAQFGKPVTDLLGEALTALFITDEDDQPQPSERPLSFLLGTRSSISDVTLRLAGCARESWWLVTGRPRFDARGEFTGYRGSAKDVTAAYRQQRHAFRLAQFDTLTGLANRHRMSSRLEKILTAYRATKRCCSLMMLDLDRFKHVNDTLGHPAGDELLKQVAQRLKGVVGKEAEIGRLGGDEFQLILPDFEDRGDLGIIAGRIVQMLSQPYSIEGSRAIIGTSIGIAVAPYDGIDSDDLVKSADLALYAAKTGGRGQYRFYSSEFKDKAEERRTVEEELRDALARGELKLRYQPVVRAADNRMSGFEALVRWEHPKRGAISPALFIPIAEENGLIVQLGEWAMRQACEDAAGWPGKLRVAVNVSATQFSTDALPAMVANALARSGLDPARLELEITESVFMGDAGSVDAMFQALKKLGVRLALDDFGTGYSSLGYLRKAPFDKIKIDQTFVRGCTDAQNPNSAIIAAIVSLAEALGLETTAEGVEAMDELAHVCARGATHIQGFVYSGAIENSAIADKLASGELSLDPVGPEKYRPERQSVYRRVGLIDEDYRYEVVLKNLSERGALIEGLIDVPVGTNVVIDFGQGQLAVATVRRSEKASQGVEFETPLVSDGAGGLVTRHRISTYAMASAGMPSAALPGGTGGTPFATKSAQPRFTHVDVLEAGWGGA